MHNFKLICSECQGKIEVRGKEYVCTKCGRKKTYRSKEEQEVNMDDQTKDYDQALFG